MKKILLSLIIILSFILIQDVTTAQTLTQANFISVTQPKIMGSGSNYRLPVVFRATLENLTPNTIYRYYNQAARFTDIGGTNPGAGNPLFINPDSSKYVYTTSPGIKNAGAYNIFYTNSSGSYTGWFSFVYTSNARFTPGNYIIPTIVLAIDTNIVSRLALNDSILVASFGASSADTSCTGIWGKSNGNPRNLVLLYDNVDGSGKPLSLSYFENEGVNISSVVSFYSTNVNGMTGRWGTIIPNNNSNGVRRIEQRSIADNSIIGFQTSSDGIWSSVNTINPNGGLTAIALDSLSSLPVELISFSAYSYNNKISLSWKTASEINNFGFEIERKDASCTYRTLAFIRGAGSSNEVNSYIFSDDQISSDLKYWYRLKQVDMNGSFKYSDEIEVTPIPVSCSLSQNYPNPFNPSTLINYSFAKTGFVTLKITNVLGQQVALLVNETEEAGNHAVNFSASEYKLSSGIYFYTLETPGFSLTRKMILNK